MNKMSKAKKQGFTLIELLIVIAIIGILSTLAVVALQSARQSARDAKRISDIKQMQIALELYYNTRGEYPDNVTSSIEHNGLVYMAKVPIAPNPADGDCQTASNTYEYIQQDSGASYTIDFCLGSQTGALSSGAKQAVPGGIISDGVIFGGGGTPPPSGALDCSDIILATCGVDNGNGSCIYNSYEYDIVKINNQCWFAENLQTTTYNNGTTSIPYDHANWTSAGINPAWSWPGINGGETFDNGIYGKLYNWHAVGTGNLCPDNWRVPSYLDSGPSDFGNLVSYLEVNGQGGSGTAVGGKMKSNRTDPEDHPRWGSPNELGDSILNSSGFNVLPSGGRFGNGGFSSLGSSAFFWSSSDNGILAWYLSLGSSYFETYRDDIGQTYGHSVRCLRTN